jgi:hypothetical protein
MLIEGVGLFVGVGDDMSEESHAVIALPNPERDGHSRQVEGVAGTR